MSTSISSGIGDLPCFTTFMAVIPILTEDSYCFFVLVCLLLYNIIMTGEPKHTELEERMVQGLLMCSPPITQTSMYSATLLYHTHFEISYPNRLILDLTIADCASVVINLFLDSTN